MNLSVAAESDTLKISAIGYIPIIAPLTYLNRYKNQADTTYELDPQVETLNECIVKGSRNKTVVLGNTSKGNAVCAGFASNELGTEVGTVLKYNEKKPGKPGHIENVNFNMVNNGYDSVKFRVNIYDFKEAKTGNSILKNL